MIIVIISVCDWVLEVVKTSYLWRSYIQFYVCIQNINFVKLCAHRVNCNNVKFINKVVILINIDDLTLNWDYVFQRRVSYSICCVKNLTKTPKDLLAHYQKWLHKTISWRKKNLKNKLKDIESVCLYVIDHGFMMHYVDVD